MRGHGGGAGRAVAGNLLVCRLCRAVTRPQDPQLHGGPHLGEIRLPPQYVNPAESWMETMKEYLPGGDTSLPPTIRGVRGWPAAAQGKWNVTARQVVNIGHHPGHASTCPSPRSMFSQVDAYL